MKIRHFFASLFLSFGLGACTTSSNPAPQPEKPAGEAHEHVDGSVHHHGPEEKAHPAHLNVRQGYYQ